MGGENRSNGRGGCNVSLKSLTRWDLREKLLHPLLKLQAGRCDLAKIVLLLFGKMRGGGGAQPASQLAMTTHSTGEIKTHPGGRGVGTQPGCDSVDMGV